MNLTNKLGKKLKHIDNNLKYYTYNGILFSIMITLSRTYAVKFLDRLGGNSLHYSLISSLPGFIAIFTTIPGLIIMNNSSHKQKLMGGIFISSRIFNLLFALVIFLPLQSQPIIFVFLYSLMNLPESISASSLQSFTGDIFIPEHRADAISLRNKFSTFAQVGAMFLLGLILRLPSTNKGAIYLYVMFFIISFVIGVIEIITFFKLKPLNGNYNATKIAFNLQDTIKDILKNKKYIIFLICSILFHFSWQMGWSIFNIYQINYLKADELWLTLINVSSNLVMALSFNSWNKIIKSKGNSLAVVIATLGMGITPILYVLSPTLLILTLTSSISGYFTAGTTVVILNSLLEVSEEKNRLISIGLHNTFTSITLTIGPLISNYILNKTNIILTLIIIAIIRIISSGAFLIRYIREKKAPA